MKTKPLHGNCQKFYGFTYTTVFLWAPRFAVDLEPAIQISLSQEWRRGK